MQELLNGTRNLLDELVDAQARDDVALRYPSIERHAAAVADLAGSLGEPVLWPTGGGAQRLLGAVEVVSRGRAHIRGWNTDVRGKAVLVVDVVAVSAQGILLAAAAAKAQGAVRVDACAIDVTGLPDSLPGVATFTWLAPS